MGNTTHERGGQRCRWISYYLSLYFSLYFSLYLSLLSTLISTSESVGVRRITNLAFFPAKILHLGWNSPSLCVYLYASCSLVSSWGLDGHCICVILHHVL